MSDFFRPEVQTLPREQIRSLQEERLQAVVARIASVPFWREKLAGLDADDIKSLDDLAKIPRTVKGELRADEAAHPPFGTYRAAPIERCVRVSTSTGTTGRPTISAFTVHDLEVEYDAGGRMFWRQGYRPGDVITHAHPGGLNGGQALLGGVIEHFGALNVAVGPPMSPADAERAVALWAELMPTHFEIFGPALHTFREAASAKGVDPDALGIPEPADMPPWRTVSAGLECFAFLGSACDQRRGAHVCEDEAIVEAVDPLTGEQVPDGTRGSLVVTTLTKDNAMLRYDLEDLVRLERDPCPCGETHLRAFWDGRLADVVLAGGKQILPIDVQVALTPIDAVSRPALEFQIVRSAQSDVLRVRVEAPDPNEALANEVTEALETATGAPVVVDLLESGVLPRPFYKPLRVVDE